MLVKKSHKSRNFFECINCQYKTVRKSDFNKHLTTRKHKNASNASNANELNPDTNFTCKCGRKYIHDSSFYRHIKICNIKIDETENAVDFDESDNEEIDKSENVIIKSEDLDYGVIITELKNIIVNQQKQLGDQQKQIGELIPKIGNNNNNIKQKFNINVFLNEQCKDAMTMNMFIDNLKVTLEDLFLTKSKGITEGITNIITKNMNKLSVYERPLHCTDVKRETVYIKSEGEGGAEWEKDAEQNKLKKAIKEATYIQSKNLNLYTDKNPDWVENESKQTEYMTMVKNSMDDINMDNRVGKVVKKLCNTVYYSGDEYRVN